MAAAADRVTLPLVTFPRHRRGWWLGLRGGPHRWSDRGPAPVGALVLAVGAPGPASGGTVETPVDDVGLEELMITHAEAAYRVALSVTRDPDLAEDVTQDAMLKAWQALPTFRGDSPLRNWVLRITHNTAISALRRRRDVLHDPSELPERATPRSVERQAHGRLALEAFGDALDELDEMTRSIVVLREIEALSYDEIAALLEVPLPTVKTRLLRARRRLAAALEGWRA